MAKFRDSGRSQWHLQIHSCRRVWGAHALGQLPRPVFLASSLTLAVPFLCWSGSLWSESSSLTRTPCQTCIPLPSATFAQGWTKPCSYRFPVVLLLPLRPWIPFLLPLQLLPDSLWLGLCSQLRPDFSCDLLSSFEEPGLGRWSAGEPYMSLSLVLIDSLVDEDLVLGLWLDPELQW